MTTTAAMWTARSWMRVATVARATAAPRIGATTTSNALVRCAAAPVRRISIWPSGASQQQAQATQATQATSATDSATTAAKDTTQTADTEKTDGAKQETQESAQAGAQEVAELRKQLVDKDAQIAKLTHMYRTALADAENVRRRSREEVENTKKYAISRFAKELLDVADVLHMALDAVPPEHRGDSDVKALSDLYTGVRMTRDNLLKTMKRFGIERFEPLGEEFDPNMHQALFQQPVPGKKSGIVFSVAKSGFRIGDRVLRPAQVGVVKHPEDA